MKAILWDQCFARPPDFHTYKQLLLNIEPIFPPISVYIPTEESAPKCAIFLVGKRANHMTLPDLDEAVLLSDVYLF